ncbi:MAG TPA: hypothetical protein VK449_08270 [Anaerolineales bacterium]|nr:hypothetical protein [Anaerolineales bacterium]
MIEIHWTEVDGVTALWTEGQPPLKAGLMFRTGRADETLITYGQTHLIEHLALSSMGHGAGRHNGLTGSLVTGFLVRGGPGDVSAFLLGVCQALQSLPADRLEAEKKILLAEESTQPYSVEATLLMRRFGAAGHGLAGAMPQYGIKGATLDQLHESAQRRFTRDNAVLWLDGPLPSDLRLPLPPGERQDLPTVVPVQQTFPCWFLDNQCGGIAVGATVSRLAAAPAFSAAAWRRLHQRLRIGEAVSYAPRVFYEPLSAQTAHLVLYADSNDATRKELAAGFCEVFEGLTQFEESEVEATLKEYREHRTGSLAPPLADRMVDVAFWTAMNWLIGREVRSTEESEAEVLRVTATDMAAFGQDVQQTAMFALPGKAIRRPSMGAFAPKSTLPVVEGRQSLSQDAPANQMRLVHGPDGVSLTAVDGSHLTVRYAQLAAALHYPDGAVQLIGTDATALMVEPTLWRGGPPLCREILERVPAPLLLERSARPPTAIPRPRTTAWQRLRARTEWKEAKRWSFVALAVFLAIMSAALTLSLISAIFGTTNEIAPGAFLFLTFSLWALAMRVRARRPK